jgi:hypothetical protein
VDGQGDPCAEHVARELTTGTRESRGVALAKARDMQGFRSFSRVHARDDREETRACREHNVRRAATTTAFVSLATLVVACGAPSVDGGAAILDEQPIVGEPTSGGEQTKRDAVATTEPAPRIVAPSETGVTSSSGGEAPSLASQLLAKMGSTCKKVSASPYAMNSGGSAVVDVCGLTNAVYWHADLDVDCDGKPSTLCNGATDPWFQAETAASDSKGDALDAAELPYVVVPGVSTRWSYKASGIAMGSVVAVIYDDKVELGIVGDVGPTGAIGEASYAMAKRLGIDPNPKTGGASSGVTYLIFTGTSGIVTKKEDHAEATALGQKRIKQFLAEN